MGDATYLAAVLVGQVQGVARELDTAASLPLDEEGVLAACINHPRNISSALLSHVARLNSSETKNIAVPAGSTYGQSPKQGQRVWRPF